MNPDYSHIKSLTDELDKSLGELRELLECINEAIEDETNYEIENNIRDFRDAVDKAIDDMDDAADTMLINISRL